MIETETQQKEFTDEHIGVTISVEDKLAKMFISNVMTHDHLAEYTQDEIREFISLLLDVHEHMDQNQQEDNQMKLFDDSEFFETEEVFIGENPEEVQTEQSVQGVQEFSEIIANSTAFLYMTEDYSNQRISKQEIHQALHILRDSIESYINSLDMNKDGKEKEQPKDSVE